MDLSKVCRCCLAEEGYKDLSSESMYDGREPEVFSEMLLNTFNITMSNLCNVKNLICEECIRKLRDADSFRKKVVESEETLMRLLKGNTKHAGAETLLKQECVEHNTDYDFDDKVDANFDDNFVWDVGDAARNDNDDKGQIFVIKLEPNDEKGVKSKIGNAIKITKKSPNDVSESKDNASRTWKGKKRKQEYTTAIKKKTTEPKRKRPWNITETSQAQIASRENSLKLVLTSNMCLFKSLKTKFRCFHCKESYITMPELREHYKTHSEVKNLKHRFNLLKGLSYKSVDISDLACNICSENCAGLSELRSHLIEKHDTQFKDGEHFLIPYRLADGFKCVLCSQIFNTFTRLAIHMNSHYAHNVCEICGVSYINRLSLRMHFNSVHKEKKCSHCPATFHSHYLKVKHLKKMHNVGSCKRYCLLCDKTFPYTYLLMEHKIREHGEKRQISDCPDCGKSFLTPQNLKVHIRSVHVKERNYPCTVCGMRFFTKCDQKRHEMTHEDVKSFSCSYCEGRFKTKDSWRRHMKRQHGQLHEGQ